MDAFLRRVLEQRELERVRDLMAGEVKHSSNCRLCGVHLRLRESQPLQTVCMRCGGRDKQRQLERESPACASTEQG